MSKKTTKKMIMFLLLCVFTCTFLLTACSFGFGKRINLNNYLDITYTGYDGGGKVSATLDRNALEEDYGGTLELNTDNGLYVLYEGMSISDIIADMVSVDFSPNGSLSNGDKTMEDWIVDEEHLESLLGCSIVYSNKTITVEGLSDTSVFDPFAEIDVTFSGTNGYGTATITANNDFGEYYDFITEETDTTTYAADELSGLSNGDEVKVEFYMEEDLEDFIDQYGSAPESYVKTYIVEGLNEGGDIDVFEGADVEFSGIEPYGTATFIISDKFKTDNWYPPYQYSIDIEDGLSNGDVVTAIFEVTDGETFVDRYGSLPMEYQKQYTVSGLDSYIMSIDDLTSDEIQSLIDIAVEQVKAQVGETVHFYVGGVETNDVTITYKNGGNPDYIYFYMRNDGPENDELSSIGMVYAISAVGHDSRLETGDTDTYNGYYIVTFDNLLRTEDGDLIGTSDVQTSNAYESFDELYTDYVINKREEYNIASYTVEEINNKTISETEDTDTSDADTINTGSTTDNVAIGNIETDKLNLE